METGIQALPKLLFYLAIAEQRAVVTKGPASPVKGMSVLSGEVADGSLSYVSHDSVCREEFRDPSEALIGECGVDAAHLVGTGFAAKIVGDSLAVGVLTALDLKSIFSFYEAPLNLKADAALEGKHAAHRWSLG